MATEHTRAVLLADHRRVRHRDGRRRPVPLAGVRPRWNRFHRRNVADRAARRLRLGVRAAEATCPAWACGRMSPNPTGRSS